MNRAAMLRQRKSEEEATSLVMMRFSERLSDAGGIAASDIDAQKPIRTYGTDLLVVIDLKNWLERDVGAKMEAFEILENQPPLELSALAAGKSRFRQ